MKHKAGPNSPKKIASFVVKHIPRVNVPRMALLAINAADQTILQAYAKTANSVVFKKQVLDQSEQDQSESSDDERDYLFVGALYIGAVAEQKRESAANKWYETISIGGQEIRCKLDTGAEANVLLARIVSKMQNAKLAKTKTVFNAFGNSQIFPKGTVILESAGHTGQSCTLKYYVTDQADSPILGYKACEQLKLVKRVNIRTCFPKQSALTKQLLNKNTQMYSKASRSVRERVSYAADRKSRRRNSFY